VAGVVVLGASFTGLLAGAAAARAGHEVTVVERDELSTDPRPRNGVPQSLQPHVLLHRGLLAIEALLPGVEDELLALGGVRFNTGAMPWLGEYGWMPQTDWSYEIVSLTRPVLEHVVRSRVAALPGVRLLGGTTVTGLSEEAGRWEVAVRGGRPLAADIVLDASGRGSRLPHWLTGMGVDVAEPVTVEARVGYASRTYRGRLPLETGVVVAAVPATQTGGLVLPVEDDRWLVCAVGFGEHRPGRDPEAFLDALSALRDPAVYDIARALEPEGDVRVHRQTGNRRYAYGRAGGWRRGLLVVGDALCAFDPVYGQGITVAAVQAEMLATALVRPPTTLSATRRLQRRLGAVADLPWSVATSEDLRMPSSDGEQDLRQRLSTVWTRRMVRLAAGGDEQCTRAFASVYHLMGSPSQLFGPRVVSAILRSCIRGVPTPAARPAVLARIGSLVGAPGPALG